MRPSGQRTCLTERPASAECRVNGERMEEAREEIAKRQVNDEDVGRRPQPLESSRCRPTIINIILYVALVMLTIDSSS